MIYFYFLPGLLLFIVNVVLFTHTEQIEKHFDANLTDVKEIKDMIRNVPYESQFLVATVMTAVVGAVFTGLLVFWPVLIIKSLFDRGVK